MTRQLVRELGEQSPEFWTALQELSGNAHRVMRGDTVWEQDARKRWKVLTRPRLNSGGSVITGAHTIIYSPAAAEIRAFFRDILEFPSVDAGEGWLIFALPPAELAMHPTDGMSKHELYLMCDDIGATVDELKRKGVEVAEPISDRGWGLLTTITLPGGSELGLYQPRQPHRALTPVGQGRVTSSGE
jgi:hypothetical protein